jgi:hypothetical protein
VCAGTRRTPVLWQAPSDYLALRRVQYDAPFFPEHMDPDAQDLCSRLLTRDPVERLRVVRAGASPELLPLAVVLDGLTASPATGAEKEDVSHQSVYAAIRAHPFFLGAASAEPSVEWLALRQVCRDVAAAVKGADAPGPGGPPPPLSLPKPPLLVPTGPALLASLRRQLWLRGVLHAPAVRSWVCELAGTDAAVARVSPVGAAPFDPFEVLGLTRDLQGAWSEDSTMAVLALPYQMSVLDLPHLEAAVAAVAAFSPLPRALLVLRQPAGADEGVLSAAANASVADVRACLRLLPESVVVVPSPAAATLLGVCAVQPPHFGFWCGGARVLFIPAPGGSPSSAELGACIVERCCHSLFVAPPPTPATPVPNMVYSFVMCALGL